MAEEKTKETKPTEYTVMATPDAVNGPWMLVGKFTTHGQNAAKKAGASKLETEELELFHETPANALYYIAFPSSAFTPQQPKVRPASFSF